MHIAHAVAQTRFEEALTNEVSFEKYTSHVLPRLYFTLKRKKNAVILNPLFLQLQHGPHYDKYMYLIISCVLAH